MSRVVARGSVRVDARRAVEKLREHLLTDLSLYALEIVRAAVAGGATYVDVRHDAELVQITFDGGALDAASLPRLLDHVLDPARDAAAQQKRLLALGVNAAIGLDPAHVAVSVRAARDQASPASGRVRWNKELLAAEALPELEPLAAGDDVPAGSVRVEVRRRLGWSVLRAAAMGTVPREIELLGDAVHDLQVPLTLAGRPFPKAPRRAAILRVELDVPGARRVTLEMAPARDAASEIELCEHGVRLLRGPLVLAAPFAPWLLGRLGLRVMVDADELPTNASRSALLEDSPLLGRVAAASLDALLSAVRALTAQVTSPPGEVPAGVTLLTGGPLAIEEALTAVIRLVTTTADDALPGELRALLDLPLLRDGAGHPLAPSAVRPDAAGVLQVWKSPEPLPEDLHPWAQYVVWLQGRPAEELLAAYQTADAAPFVERARLAAARRRKLLDRAPSEPALPASLVQGAAGAPALRASFHVREGDFTGLRGEVAVLAPGLAARKIHVFVEGRLLETIEVDASLIPLRFEAALEWEGRLVPRFSYEGVEPDQSFRQAAHYAVIFAAFLVEGELERALKTRDAEAVAGLHPVARAAIGAVLVAAEGLGVVASLNSPSLAAFRRLHGEKLWPTATEGRRESLATLGRTAMRDRAIAVARPGARGRAPDDRPVITAHPREAAWLARAWPGVELYPYDGALIEAGAESARRERQDEALAGALADEIGRGAPALAFAAGGHRGLCVASLRPRLHLFHAGKLLASRPLPPTRGAITIAIDGDAFIPDRTWTGLHADPLIPLAALSRDYCHRVVAALEGDPESQRRLGVDDPVPVSPELRGYLFERAHRLRSSMDAAEVALADRIELLPLLTVLDAAGNPTQTTLASVGVDHPAPRNIPVLLSLPGFETLDWRPVLAATSDEVRHLATWSGGRARSAEGELAARQAQALEDRERRAFLTGPEQDPRDVGDLAQPGGTSVFEAGGGVTVAAALPRLHIETEHAWIDVLYGGRALCRRALPDLRLPVVARVGLSDASHVSSLRDLSAAGVERVTQRLHSAATALALALIAGAEGPGKGAALLGERRALRLVRALLTFDETSLQGLDLMLAMLTKESGEPRHFPASLPSALQASDLLYPTVQGEEQPRAALHGAAGETYFGRVRHVPWREDAGRPTDLDRPILHLPATTEGELLAAIFVALGARLRDVTELAAALQQQRARAEPREVPRLAGAPVHPALRVSLVRLGVDRAEGELEIHEGPASEVHFIDLAGDPRRIDAVLSLPLRVVARLDTVSAGGDADRAVLRGLVRAAGRHLLSLEPRFGELPDFVRGHLRRSICDALARKKRVVKRAASAAVFPDIADGWHSLRELRERHEGTAVELCCTHDPPPYPAHRLEAPERASTLRLTEPEMRALATTLRLKNLTMLLRRELQGERRAGAPPLGEIALDAEARNKCVAWVRVAEGSLAGEVGLLAPEHHGARGIAVSVGGRPLCEISDGAGWPLVAALDDTAAKPNRAFDNLHTPGAVLKLRRAARAAAGRALRQLVTPPADALAVQWFEGLELGVAGATIAGALWLPSAWPAEPRIRARLGGAGGAPVRRSLVAAQAPAFHFGDLPIEGELLVPEGVPWPAVVELAFGAAAGLLDGAARGTPSAARDAYEWDLRLLGATSREPRPAATATGDPIPAAAILTELAERGCLCITGLGGSADGDFPDHTPAFILLAEASPLVEVLRHRGPPGTLRELGALPSAPVAAELAPAPLAPLDPEAKAPAASPGDGSFLADLWEAVRSFFGREDEAESELTAVVHRALVELRLAGEPVDAVREVRSGRPVRYDREARKVLLNTRHRALRWLVPSSAGDPCAVALLSAAAVCEINRLLVEVTDEHERRALASLLAGVAGAPGSP